MLCGYASMVAGMAKQREQNRALGDEVGLGPFLLSPHILQRMTLTGGLGVYQFAPDMAHSLPALLASATVTRKVEYLVSRACAAALLRQLGAPTCHVGMQEDRSPIWPPGFVGSITHTRALIAVAVGSSSRARSLGIDAESLVDDDGLTTIARYCLQPQETLWLDRLPSIAPTQVGTLIFSAKEAFYKCLYPHINQYIDFTDAVVDAIDCESGVLRLRLLKSPAANFPDGFALEGTFRFAHGHVFTAFEFSDV